jgi:DNA-binding NtrC family response regulator
MKQDLEEKIKEKVNFLVEESMQKNWGLTIPKIESDISNLITENEITVYFPLDIDFKDAKLHFKKEFLKQELKLNKGNVLETAKSLDINRRSIHRTIKELNINVDNIRDSQEEILNYQKEFVSKGIKKVLDNYKEIIKEDKFEKMYQETETLSRNIVKILPHRKITWKEAEKEFEKKFLTHSLKENDYGIKKTAQKIGLRNETLSRKIKELQLRNIF